MPETWRTGIPCRESFFLAVRRFAGRLFLCVEPKGEAKMADLEDAMVGPGNNRAMQKRRTARRRLFGKKAKEAFLESFSCTANVAASAAAVGFSEGAVYTARRADGEFRELFWMALEQAAGKLAALRIEHEIARAEGRLAPGIEAAMDGPPDARQIADLVKLMAALRDLTRNLTGKAAPGGRPPESASLDDACKALAKRLRAFGARAEAEARG
jgi:hypothetical protein